MSEIVTYDGFDHELDYRQSGRAHFLLEELYTYILLAAHFHISNQHKKARKLYVFTVIFVFLHLWLHL